MSTSNYNTAPSPLCNLLLGAVMCSAILLATLPGGNLINLALSVAFVGAVIFAAFAGKRSLWFSPELLILVAWLSFSMIGTLMAESTNNAMFKSITMVQILVLAFCVQQVVIWNRGNPTNLVAYGVAVAISYLLTFSSFSAQEIAGAEDVAGDVSRIASTLNDENTFGAVALMGFSFVLIALAKTANRALIVPLAILLILLLAAVINSGSRTAFIGAFLVLLGAVWAFRLWQGVALGKFLFTAFVALAVSGAVFFAAKSIPEVEDRIDAVFSADSAIASRVEGLIDVVLSGDTKAEAGNSIDERVSMISSGLEVIADHPAVGVGLDNFRVVTGAGTYAHSNLIEVGVSTGVIGFIIYHLMYVALTFRIFRLIGAKGAAGTVARLALVGLMAYFLMDITRVSYYEKTSWLYFASLGALIEVLVREVRQTRIAEAPSKKRRRRRKRSGNNKEMSESSNGEFDDIDELFTEQNPTNT